MSVYPLQTNKLVSLSDCIRWFSVCIDCYCGTAKSKAFCRQNMCSIMRILTFVFILHTSGKLDRRSSMTPLKTCLLATILLMWIRYGSPQTDLISGSPPPLPSNGKLAILYFTNVKYLFMYVYMYITSPCVALRRQLRYIVKLEAIRLTLEDNPNSK